MTYTVEVPRDVAQWLGENGHTGESIANLLTCLVRTWRGLPAGVAEGDYDTAD